MPWELHSGLSGVGSGTLTSVTAPTFERAAVTSLGAAEALDPTAPTRYLHLGYWAFYEELVDDSSGFPDGLYIAQYHWLNFEFESWADKTSVESFGYSGFTYRFFPGVVVTLGFFSP